MKNLTETLAVEWGPYGIQVNGLVPGLFPHEDMTDDIQANLDRAHDKDACQPAMRVGQRQELGWAATFLASPYARFISGHTLVVDGANWQRRSLTNPEVVPVREQMGRGPVRTRMTQAELADRMEIDDLLTRYATAVDTRDWDLYRSVFTADAVIDYTSSGGIRGELAEVTEWLSDALSGFSMSQHMVTNRDIRVAGDAATSRSYFYNPMGRTKRDGTLALMFVGGYYRDRAAPDRRRVADRRADPGHGLAQHLTGDAGRPARIV